MNLIFFIIRHHYYSCSYLINEFPTKLEKASYFNTNLTRYFEKLIRKTIN